MKKLKVFAILLAVVAISVSACKKDDDDGNGGGGNNSNGTMTLKANGADFNATLAVQAVNNNGVINVTGSNGNGQQCSVVLYGATGPGTYQLGATNPQNLCTWTEGTGQTQTFSANMVLGSGSVTLTELSATKVVGTFQFTAFNTNQEQRSITEGAFDVSF